MASFKTRKDRDLLAYVERRYICRATDHNDRQALKVRIARMLSDDGWKIYGFKSDMSDMETDYYDPATWEGVAEKDGYVLCIGVNDYVARTRSGYVPVARVLVDSKECSCCGGSGRDPSGWTLEAARADPVRYNNETSGDGLTSLFPDVVSPIPFRDDGFLRCRECGGTGKMDTFEDRPDPDSRWPEFQANPPSRTWHLEKGGKILAKGTGLWSRYSSNSHIPQVARYLYLHLAGLLERATATMPESLRFRRLEPDDQLVKCVRAGNMRGIEKWLSFGADPTVVTAEDIDQAGHESDSVAFVIEQAIPSWAHLVQEAEKASEKMGAIA